MGPTTSGRSKQSPPPLKSSWQLKLNWNGCPLCRARVLLKPQPFFSFCRLPPIFGRSYPKIQENRFGRSKLDTAYSSCGLVLSCGCAALGSKSSPSLELSSDFDQTKFTIEVTPCHPLILRLACSEL